MLGGAIGGLIISAVLLLLQAIFSQLADMMATLLANLNGLADFLLEDQYVKNAILVAQSAGGALLAVRLGHDALRTYVLHTSGDPGADPGGLLRRAALAAGAVAGGPWIVSWVYDLGTALATDFGSGGRALPQNFSDFVKNLQNDPNLLRPADNALAALILAIIFVVAAIFIGLQVAIRAWHLAGLAVLGPILAAGLLAENEGVWGAWWKKLVTISFAQAAQIFFLRAIMEVVGRYMFPINILIALAGAWVAIKAPAIIEELSAHTGVGAGIGAAGQSASTAVIFRLIGK